MELSDFTPAQTLMLIKPSKVDGKDLLKYSFLDLIYKEKLKIYQDWRLPHPRETRERLYTIVARGKQFSNNGNSFHQDPFVSPFQAKDVEYQVRTLIKKVYLNSGKGPGFKSNWVYKQLKEEGYFMTSLGFKKLDIFFLNSEGSSLKSKFNTILKDAENSLPHLVKSNKEKTKEIISTLGSNILLLDCFNDELIKQLKPLFKEIGDKNLSQSSESYVDFGDASELMFYGFLDTIDYFDSSFDSFLDATFDVSGFDIGGDFGGFDFGGFDW